MKMKKSICAKKLFSLVLSLLLAFSAIVPAFAAEDEFAQYLGEAVSLTEGLTSTVTGQSTAFKIGEKITLDRKDATDICEALNTAQWRAIVKLNLSEKLLDGMLAAAHYYTWTGSEWADSGLINESEYFIANEKAMIIAVPVTAQDLEKQKVTAAYAFDWDNSGVDETLQVVTVELDMSKVELVHSEGCTENMLEAAVAPTCNEPGYTKVSECSICGLPISGKQEIPALGHDFKEKIIEDSHYKESADGVSVYYYNCAREGCDEISTKDTYTVNESDYNPPVATVTPITQGLTVDAQNPSVITVTNTDEITLDFAEKDESIGRYMDGWWAGVKITADSSMTAKDLEAVQFRSFSKNGRSEDKSFWAYKDSADDASEHFITVWVPVTPELIENDDDGFLTVSYKFDWDKNGFGITAQEITVKIDAGKVNLIHSEGHTEVVDTEAVEPTCEDGGFTKQSHCSVCGLVLSERTAVAALGHDFTEKILDEYHLAEKANCVHYDLYRYSCSRCDVMSQDKLYEDKENSVMLDHVKIRKVDELHLKSSADCENPAWYYMGCENCETVFKNDEPFSDGTPLYHSWRIEKLTKKATVTSDGTINFFCEDCGAKDNSPIPIPKVASVKLSATKFAYTGKSVTPSVTVKDRTGKTLTKDKDYTVKYINSDLPGTAAARITFIGNYEGTYDAKYTVDIPVTGKIAFASNNNTIKIAWEKVSVATGYWVYYKTASGWNYLGSTSSTSATFKNLPSGTKYTFAVRAGVVKNGKTYLAGSYKTIDTVTTSPAPTKVVASQSTSAIKLTWTAVKGADGYAVLLKTQSGWKTLGLTTKTTATLTGLASGTNYIYAVRSVNLTASGQIIGGGYIQITTATKPVTPVVSVTTQNGTASIKWTAVKGASGYQVYYKSTASGGFVLLGTVGAGVTSFTDSGYTTGSKYAFAVRATKAVQGGYIYGTAGQTIVTMN